MAEFCSSRALQLDAEYDAGASDVHSNDDSDDLECFAPVGKLARKAPFSSSRRPDRKRQKTEEKEEKKSVAPVEKAEPPDNSEESGSDLDAIVRPLAATNSPSQRKINALQQQMKQVVEGYNSTAAAFADISATEETQEEGAPYGMGGCGGIDEALRKSITIGDSEPASARKCVIEVKANESEQGKKFRIFMTDPMSKIFTAYCAKSKLQREEVKFVFDGLAIADTATPGDLDMEAEEENMIELQVMMR